MKWPALDVRGADSDLVLVVVDDYSPTAIEEQGGALTIYFSDSALRDNAREAVARHFPAAQVSIRDVDDEDWARRSQENLGPVAVGRITIAPPWCDDASTFDVAQVDPEPVEGSQRHSQGSAWPQAPRLVLVIQPSMGFGTGHHPTTRLCLVALQSLNLADTFVLDVGTGSGILAIAARMLGASEALGIDNDPDALQCGRENLALNPTVDNVRFALGDVSLLRGDDKAGLHVARGLQSLRPADVVTANLTAALLCRSAVALANAFAPRGALIVSGVLAAERTEVVAAFHELDLVWEAEEEGWVGLGFARL